MYAIRSYYDLNPSVIRAGMATIEEIRQALIDFKESGKFIYAYSDGYSQKAYYLASVADKVAINPQGMLELQGLNSKRMFYNRITSYNVCYTKLLRDLPPNHNKQNIPCV